MSRSNQFSPEVRECAVCLLQDHCGLRPSRWAPVEMFVPKVGCVPQPLLD